MMIVSERLFEVIPESATYKAVQRYLKAHEDVSSDWAEFCKKYGATEYFGGDQLLGLIFERGEQPAGWINPKHIDISRAYRPNFRDKVCAEAAREFKALPSKPSMFAWLDMLGIPLKVGGNRSMKAPGFKKIAGTYYLTASEGCAVPDDVEEVSSKKAAKLQEIEEQGAA
tara:strand:+ start:194 stop:703 length:510 start_codon:yes stop_codon:yes gene_type:complete